MKRIFLLVLVLSMFAGSANGESNEPAKEDTNGEPTEAVKEDTTPTQQPSAEELAYRADTETILKILGNIRDFRREYGDTQVQAKARERKQQETLARINTKYKGTRLTLQRVELDNVIANDDITHLLLVGKSDWEVPGKYTATYYIPLPEKKENPEESPLYKHGIAIGQHKYNADGTNAYEEFRQGLPAGKLDFKSFQYLEVEIVKTFPTENSVLNLRKYSIAPLTGRIRGVKYREIDDKLTIWID